MRTLKVAVIVSMVALMSMPALAQESQKKGGKREECQCRETQSCQPGHDAD